MGYVLPPVYWRLMNESYHRPEPILAHTGPEVTESTPARACATLLIQGERLLVTDSYGTGVEILEKLRARLKPPADTAPFEQREAFEQAWRETAIHLLVPIRGHVVALRNARNNGFLKQLYPSLPDFYLPLIRVQKLYGAWQLYRTGVHLGVLGFRIHPFYDTYAPTRVSHLELFATWLSQYKGAQKTATDVGTGCGVLAFMLCKAGFTRILATDSNPNAIESVTREIDKHKGLHAVTPKHGDLFAGDGRKNDLIVFNPPWIKGQVDGMLDRALYFEDDLFERFFDAAYSRLAPSGRVVLLFSNIMELVQPHEPHPITTELSRGRFTLVQKLRRKVVPKRDASGQRRRTKERVEVWELAKVQG